MAIRLDHRILNEISNKIYRSHPDFANVKPKVHNQTVNGRGSKESDQFLLIFSNKVEGPGGRKIQKNLRVVVNSSGRILKKSVSK